MPNKHIALININRFDPLLRDGASITMLEIMRFIKSRGTEVSIVNFLTNDNAGMRKILRPENMGFNPAREEIDFVQKQLACSMRDLSKHSGEIIGAIEKELKLFGFDIVFTLDACPLSLTAASLAKIPGAHFFHSLSNVVDIAINPFYIRMLSKRVVFANSPFIQAKIRELLGINSIVWEPMINFDQYRPKQNVPQKSNCIGYYGGSTGKGGEVFLKIAQKMPENHFILVGSNRPEQSAPPPRNIEYLGQVKDMNSFYEKIKILLIPSVIEEAFSRVAVEASINGIPIIANKIGGLPDTLGNSGILIDFDPNQQDEIIDKYVRAIDQLLTGADEYSLFSQKALHRAKELETGQIQKNQEICDRHILTLAG